MTKYIDEIHVKIRQFEGRQKRHFDIVNRIDSISPKFDPSFHQNRNDVVDKNRRFATERLGTVNVSFTLPRSTRRSSAGNGEDLGHGESSMNQRSFRGGFAQGRNQQ